MEQKDNGDWLSAQQAVRPDGSEVTNLPLINKKLPPLSADLTASTKMAKAAQAVKKSDGGVSQND
jgi:hypothetical protein